MHPHIVQAFFLFCKSSIDNSLIAEGNVFVFFFLESVRAEFSFDSHMQGS